MEPPPPQQELQSDSTLPAPPSPGIGAVQLKECVEELLKFTLKSSINGEVELGLSKHYCSQLLQHDPSNSSPSSIDILGGVPSYPLYKHLAASLYLSISAGALVSTSKKISSIHEKRSLRLKENEWTMLIVEKGTEILNTDAKLLKEGVQMDVLRYASFLDMLQVESLQRVLPGVATLEEGVQVYRNFYSEEKESSNGVVAICVTKSTPMLHNFMASILSGLSYAGIQTLLNMAYTEGTISEALPPSTSALVSSFLAPHNPHVKGSTLTNGARALAKHINRSSDKYWGDFCGSDSDKNKAALDVISRFVSNCCWMNMHVVPPHGTVFEIRVAEGFGARWSEDGSKFLGFLEPYMVDGHSRGWRH